MQGELADALTTLLRVRTVPVGAGRTDSGVHADGQVASVRVSEPPNVRRLHRGLNGLTGPDLVVRDVSIAPDAFHARKSAIEREYRYVFLAAPSARFARMAWYPGPLDVDRVREALPLFLGVHDFTSFAAAGDGAESKVCEVRAMALSPWERGVVLSVAADRFLQRMVRNIVGTLVQIGSGRRAGSDVPATFAARDRRAAGPTAPPNGLVLARVTYPDALRP